MKKTSNVSKIWKIVLCVFLYIVLQVSTVVLDRLGIKGYNGVLMAFQFVCCLTMVWVDYKVGTLTSFVLMGYSIINVTVVMLVSKQIGPLPGFCNMMIYVLCLVLLVRQFHIREKDAITDDLTGLMNRRGMYQKIDARIAKEKPFYVVYIDLWNFKVINDNYGHAYGDNLLRLVTERVTSVVGKDVSIARIGGDEFVLLVHGEEDVAELTERILKKLEEKAPVVTNSYVRVDSYLKTYAGVSRFPNDGTDAETLIKCADIAMYHASRQDAKQICFFDKDMEKHLTREMELEKLIKEGLEKDYFYLMYQPQYHIEGKKLRGFEALLRMKSAKGEYISPAEFIPVAEKGELILQIDDYVLRRAMKEFRDVVTQVRDELTISVNVSAKNISSKGFADKVKQLLEETGFPAKHLEIEITEYCMVESVELTIENIVELRALGVQVALDDFGTGYTSLSYLAKMPINLLKVDKSLVDDIVADEKSRDFVTAVIAMGHMMGCEVISEGVESEDQLHMLNEQECDFVQGYVWGKPLAYDVARDLALGA